MIFLLLLFPALGLAFTDVTSVFECYNCIQYQAYMVCRDERTTGTAYCCSPTETGRACTQRDFCSSNMKTLSMQMTTCPYMPRTCGNYNTTVSLMQNQTQHIVIQSNVSKTFNSTSICYYTINADFTGVNVSQRNRSQIWVTVWSYSNVYVHIANGTQGERKLANSPVQVNPLNTGMFFNYSALNNTIYVVIVGNEANPSVNLSLSFYQPPLPPVVVNDTNQTVDIIYRNVTEYVNRTVSVFGKTRPLVSSIIIISCIVFGSLIAITFECLRQVQETRKKKDFDILDNFQFSERQDEYSTNRNLFKSSMQDNNNYESNATNQDLLPDHRNFATPGNHQRGDSFVFKKQSNTSRPTIGSGLIELPMISKKKIDPEMFKVHPVDDKGNLTGRDEKSNFQEVKGQTGGISSWFQLGTSRSRKSNKVLPLNTFQTVESTIDVSNQQQQNVTLVPFNTVEAIPQTRLQ